MKYIGIRNESLAVDALLMKAWQLASKSIQIHHNTSKQTRMALASLASLRQSTGLPAMCKGVFKKRRLREAQPIQADQDGSCFARFASPINRLAINQQACHQCAKECLRKEDCAKRSPSKQTRMALASLRSREHGMVVLWQLALS